MDVFCLLMLFVLLPVVNLIGDNKDMLNFEAQNCCLDGVNENEIMNYLRKCLQF